MGDTRFKKGNPGGPGRPPGPRTTFREQFGDEWVTKTIEAVRAGIAASEVWAIKMAMDRLFPVLTETLMVLNRDMEQLREELNKARASEK